VKDMIVSLAIIAVVIIALTAAAKQAGVNL
jgi:hypothetical protein